MTNDEMKRNAGKATDDVQGRIEQGPVQEQISDHSEVYDDMPEYEAADQLIDDSRKAARKRGWMWIAVAIALVLGAAICVLMIPELTGSKTGDALAAAKTTVSNGLDKVSDAAGSGVAVIEEAVGSVQEGVTDAAQATAGAVSDAKDKVSDAVDNAAADAAAASTDVSAATIDDEARRVIHGDFGNGAQRKAALGSHYAAVQHRVNELLHV